MQKCVISRVLLRPEERPAYIRKLMQIDGITDVEEIPDRCYCALPLTDLTVLEKKFDTDNIRAAYATIVAESEMLRNWHNTIKEYLNKAGIKTYDPGEVTHPKELLVYPRVKPDKTPREVSDIDVREVIKGRLFEYTNLAGSTGAGIEEDIAVRYNKIPYIIVRKGRYASRMGTGMRRTLVIEVDNLRQRESRLIDLFKKTSALGTGIGMCETHGNVLLLFEDGRPLCSDQYVQEMYPEFAFEFEKSIPR